jgi:hypothetical protein
MQPDCRDLIELLKACCPSNDLKNILLSSVCPVPSRLTRFRGDVWLNLPNFLILPEKFFSENYFRRPPPPSPKKFRSVYHFRGTNFSGHIQIFRDIKKFSDIKNFLRLSMKFF